MIMKLNEQHYSSVHSQHEWDILIESKFSKIYVRHDYKRSYH